MRERVANAAEAEARINNWDVVIAIVDQGGHLLYLQRENAQLGSIEVAISKAKCAVLFRSPTKALEQMVADGKQGFLTMPQMLPVEGGVPLLHNGQVVGAIGVSGITSAEDGHIARAGAKAL
nr:heme-binding protein [Methylomarinum sp. Ch1-1]MDP4520801.1 heme-binding protein [Methylomarinum sp. Ch1-1]